MSTSESEYAISDPADFLSAVRSMPLDRTEGRPIYRTQNTKLIIRVSKAELKSIGSKQVEFYYVLTETDYDGFHSRASRVERRYSEFRTLRKVLVAKGGSPVRLSWTRRIPGFVSRWEELNDWVEQLGSLNFNEVHILDNHVIPTYAENSRHRIASKNGIRFVDRLLNRSL